MRGRRQDGLLSLRAALRRPLPRLLALVGAILGYIAVALIANFQSHSNQWGAVLSPLRDHSSSDGVRDSPALRGQRVAVDQQGKKLLLVGNCDQYVSYQRQNIPHDLPRFTGKRLFMYPLGEQLTSSLIPLHAVFRMANGTRRVVVGPFLDDNMYTSQFPDALDDKPTQLPPSFITNYWNIDPMLAVYSHLCFLASPLSQCGPISPLARIVPQLQKPQTPPEGAYSVLVDFPSTPSLDLTTALLTDPTLRDAGCVKVFGAGRIAGRVFEQHMLKLNPHSPPVPLPQWLSSAPQSAPIHDLWASFYPNGLASSHSEYEEMGQRLYWMFTPAQRILDLARDFRFQHMQSGNATSYTAAHFRMEKIYEAFFPGGREGACNALNLSPCKFDACPLVKTIDMAMATVGELWRDENSEFCYLARDFGLVERSLSAAGSFLNPTDSMPAQQDDVRKALSSIKDNIHKEVLEWLADDTEPETNALVDLVMLVESDDCVVVGEGNYQRLVALFRELRGAPPCMRLNRLDEKTCGMIRKEPAEWSRLIQVRPGWSE